MIRCDGGGQDFKGGEQGGNEKKKKPHLFSFQRLYTTTGDASKWRRGGVGELISCIAVVLGG